MKLESIKIYQIIDKVVLLHIEKIMLNRMINPWKITYWKSQTFSQMCSYRKLKWITRISINLWVKMNLEAVSNCKAKLNQGSQNSQIKSTMNMISKSARGHSTWMNRSQTNFSYLKTIKRLISKKEGKLIVLILSIYAFAIDIVGILVLLHNKRLLNLWDWKHREALIPPVL